MNVLCGCSSTDGPVRTSDSERVADRGNTAGRRPDRQLRASGRAVIRQPTLALTIAATTLLAHALAITVGWVSLSAFGASASALTVLTLVVLINLGLGLLPSPAGLGLYQAAGLAVLASAATSPELAVAAATGLQAVDYGHAPGRAPLASARALDRRAAPCPARLSEQTRR